MMRKYNWALAVIFWMTAIFFFTQLPYFTGESTLEVLRHAVVESRVAGNLTGNDTLDIEEKKIRAKILKEKRM